MGSRENSTAWQLGSLRHSASLDGLRGIGVLVVLAAHSGITQLHGGFIAVDMFFLLSGFLITRLLLGEQAKRGAISLRAFYARRARRLLPALVLTLVLTRLALVLRPELAGGIGFKLSVLSIGTYTGNWVEAFSHYAEPLGVLLGHTWSLAIEEQFYTCWPLLLILCLRRRWTPRRLLVALMVAAGVSTTIRALLWFHVPLLGPGGARAYTRTDARADQLLIGCALAIVMTSSLRDRAMRVCGVVPAAVAAATLAVFVLTLDIDRGFYYLGGATIVSAATLLLIGHLYSNPSSPLSSALTLRPLAWLGKRCYGMYLYHPCVFLAVVPPVSGVLGLVARVAVTAILADVSYRFVELPIQRKRRVGAHARALPSVLPSTHDAR